MYGVMDENGSQNCMVLRMKQNLAQLLFIIF